jgi:cytochrome c biogenesis factor
VTRLLGYSALVAALAIASYGMIAAIVGVRRREAGLVRSARAAAYTCFGLLTVANLAMIYGLVTHDFSIGYVAQVGSRATPVFFTVISLWSALEGSILFWGWVLAFYAALAMWLTRSKLRCAGRLRQRGAALRQCVLLHAAGRPRQPVRPGLAGADGWAGTEPAAAEPLS